MFYIGTLLRFYVRFTFLRQFTEVTMTLFGHLTFIRLFHRESLDRDYDVRRENLTVSMTYELSMLTPRLSESEVSRV